MKALRLYLIFIVFFVSHLLASAQSSFRAHQYERWFAG